MMKRIILVLLVCFWMCGCGEIDARNKAIEKQKASAEKAINTVSIPEVSYFQERKTIARWSETFNKANVVTYVYLFNYGKCVGYFLSDGKPASTRSYLMPEENVHSGSNGNVTVSAPDIDGTYGENNPGIRFFTPEGTPVEWGGDGATYLYSTVPLELNVPMLSK